MQEEIKSNQGILKMIHDNNQATLKSFKSDKGEPENDERQFIPGLQLRKIAWQTMVSTGIANHVDYETVLVLSETYSLQSIYQKTAEMFTGAAMNMGAYAAAVGQDVDQLQFRRHFSDYMALLVHIEKEILNSYQLVLPDLEKGTQ